MTFFFDKMRLFNITYELKNSDQDYTAFFDALKGEASYIQCLKTSWFVRSERTRADIYNHLKSFLEDSDLLLISETKLELLSGWLPQDSVTWLQQQEPNQEIK